MRGQHIVAAAVDDVQDVIFGIYFADGYQLQVVLLAIGFVEEHVAGIAAVLRLGQMLARGVNDLIAARG